MTAEGWIAIIMGVAALIVALFAKDSRYRNVVIAVCAGLVIAAIVVGVVGVLSNLGFRVQRVTSPGSSNSPSSGPTTPSSGSTPAAAPRREAAKTHAEVQLSTNSSVQATLYFGQLEHVIAAMTPLIDPGLSRDVIDGNKGLCVGTVVFSGLDGASGVVYAEQLGSGWTSVEGAPTARASGETAVRQQLVVPPAEAVNGEAWRARAALKQNGSTAARSSYYTLKLTDTRSSQLTWLVNGTDVVSCRAS
jgi:hypothetical protein